MSTQAEAALEANADDLLRYFRRRVGDDDAPDLLAETVLVALRRQRAVPEDDERARMWLFVVARNVLLHHDRGVRRRLRLADRVRSVLSDAGADEAVPADDGLEVRDAIARLDPHLAELVRLVHWDRLTLAQAADVLGLPASTVRNHYQRAKEELRVSLGRAEAHDSQGSTESVLPVTDGKTVA